MTGNMEVNHRITEPMLIKAISRELKVPLCDIKIKWFEVSEGSAMGDNYACEVKAIDVVALVQGKEKKLCYIVKCVPMSEFRSDLVIKSGIFTTEVIVYESLLPRLRNLEKPCSTNPNFPKHFYASVDEGVIFMENMKLNGWYMGDKVAGGFESFKKEYEPFIQEKWISRNNTEASEAVAQTVEQMFGGFFSSFVSIMEEIWDGDKEVISSLKALKMGQVGLLDAIHKPPEPGYGLDCILHIDSWTNNFFFRNNADGVVSEAAILDLQMMKRGRPCVDLAYLIGSSTTPKFRQGHLEEMLGLYHAELSRVLLLHGYDTEAFYPFSCFREEFNECYPIAFLMGTQSLQLHLSQPDPEDLFKEASEEKREKLERQKLEMVKKDDALKGWFFDLTEEAVAYGLLRGV